VWTGSLGECSREIIPEDKVRIIDVNRDLPYCSRPANENPARTAYLPRGLERLPNS